MGVSRLVLTDAGADYEQARALLAGSLVEVLAVAAWTPAHVEWLRQWAEVKPWCSLSVCTKREAIAQAARAILPPTVQVWRGRVVSAAEAATMRGDAALAALMKGAHVEAAPPLSPPGAEVVGAVEDVAAGEGAAGRSSTRPSASAARPAGHTVQPQAQDEAHGAAAEEVAEEVAAAEEEGADQTTPGGAARALDGCEADHARSKAAAQGEGRGAFIIELSRGCGRAVCDANTSKQRGGVFVPLTRNGREVVRGLDRVQPLRVTFPELVDLLRSHTSARYRHKTGPFIVGAAFDGDDKHPSGHRCGDTLQRVTMLCLDIDGAADLTPRDLEQRLDTLGVAAVGYTTWSYGRSTKQGLCARVFVPLLRPLDAPADLQGRARVQHIGRQLAALVAYVGERLGVPLDGKALDGVSRQPEQLMYTSPHRVARCRRRAWGCI